MVYCDSNHSGIVYLKFKDKEKSIQEFSYDTTAGNWNSFDIYPRMGGDINGDQKTDIIGFYKT